ncbi:MAG: hypothetical protein COA78_24015 [Blastopirellula sp.]|nr:MAG: hypothetical protein COA78_24015 [Blastopirellula sp.]
MPNPIEAWWIAFQAKTDDIQALFSQQAEWDLPQWMADHLHAIDPELMWEFGPAVQTEGHRLVITAEARRDLRPLVSAILQRAPKIDGWEFYGYRQPEDYEMALQTVEVRTGGNISKTAFQAVQGEFNLIDLTFYGEGYSEENEQANNDVFVAIETLLGEEILDKWIGAIEVVPMSAIAGQEIVPIEFLKQHVDQLMSEIQSQLPDTPYYQNYQEEEWTAFELEPEQAEEYPQQWDLIAGVSMLPEIWQNGHNNMSFDSVRFSKCGETFCYVKMDGTDGLDEEHFSGRGDIEEALNKALREAKIGCVFGGGTGVKYSYVDLALTDIGEGAAIVKQVLQQGNIHKRSWIQFYDTDLQARWIGVYDDSPTPPLIEFEE